MAVWLAVHWLEEGLVVDGWSDVSPRSACMAGCCLIRTRRRHGAEIVRLAILAGWVASALLFIFLMMLQPTLVPFVACDGLMTSALRDPMAVLSIDCTQFLLDD